MNPELLHGYRSRRSCFFNHRKPDSTVLVVPDDDDNLVQPLPSVTDTDAPSLESVGAQTDPVPTRPAECLLDYATGFGVTSSAAPVDGVDSEAEDSQGLLFAFGTIGKSVFSFGVAVLLGIFLGLTLRVFDACVVLFYDEHDRDSQKICNRRERLVRVFMALAPQTVPKSIATKCTITFLYDTFTGDSDVRTWRIISLGTMVQAIFSVLIAVWTALTHRPNLFTWLYVFHVLRSFSLSQMVYEMDFSRITHDQSAFDVITGLLFNLCILYGMALLFIKTCVSMNILTNGNIRYTKEREAQATASRNALHENQLLRDGKRRAEAELQEAYARIAECEALIHSLTTKFDSVLNENRAFQLEIEQLRFQAQANQSRVEEQKDVVALNRRALDIINRSINELFRTIRETHTLCQYMARNMGTSNNQFANQASAVEENVTRVSVQVQNLQEFVGRGVHDLKQVVAEIVMYSRASVNGTS